MRVPEFLNGCISPVFSAWKDDGSFDADGQRNLLDFMEERGGISAYFVRSGMGQMYAYQSEAEVKALAETACKHLAGRAPVIVGANGIWDRNFDQRPDPEAFVQQCITLGRIAKDAGAGGVVYTLPEALVPDAGETCQVLTQRFFERVCAGVDLPVFVYQPPNTKAEYLMTPASIAKLATIDNVCGAKASYSDGEYVYSLIRATKDAEFNYIVGAETIYAIGKLMGATAVIGQGSTMYPKLLNIVGERLEAGDREGAFLAQDAVNRLVALPCFPQGFFKRLATESGYAVGGYHREIASNPYGERAPKPMTDDAYNTYKMAMEEEAAALMAGA